MADTVDKAYGGLRFSFTDWLIATFAGVVGAALVLVGMFFVFV